MKWCTRLLSKLSCGFLLALLAIAPAYGQSEEDLPLWDPDVSLSLLPTDNYAPSLSAGPLPGGGVLLDWTIDGILQVSDSPDGPWSDLWNAGSPFVVESKEVGKFFRVRIPGAEEFPPVDEAYESPLDRFFNDVESVDIGVIP